jgi:hypothetical protein
MFRYTRELITLAPESIASDSIRAAWPSEVRRHFARDQVYWTRLSDFLSAIRPVALMRGHPIYGVFTRALGAEWRDRALEYLVLALMCCASNSAKIVASDTKQWISRGSTFNGTDAGAAIFVDLAVSLGTKPEDTRQRVFTVLCFELADAEFVAMRSALLASMRVPFACEGCDLGLVLIASQMRRQWRETAYARVPLGLKTLSFEEFEVAGRPIRVQPEYVAIALRAAEPKYFTSSETFFGECMFEGVPSALVPDDVGRMALAFCCANVVAIWDLMRWDPLFLERASQLANTGKFRYAIDDFVTVLTSRLAADAD